MKVTKWLFSEDGINQHGEYEVAATEVHDAAELIAQELEWQSGEYPDEHEFWLFCPKRNQWLHMIVSCEEIRDYSARRIYKEPTNDQAK